MRRAWGLCEKDRGNLRDRGHLLGKGLDPTMKDEEQIHVFCKNNMSVSFCKEDCLIWGQHPTSGSDSCGSSSCCGCYIKSHKMVLSPTLPALMDSKVISHFSLLNSAGADILSEIPMHRSVVGRC